jgi:protoporphyrinogen/coproporphyrinogen III oxidase
VTGHIAIVGGGISGLAALEYLTRVAPSVDVTLLESRPQLGGNISTDRADGFVMEAGPDVFLASKPAATELAQRVGLGERLQGTDPAAKGAYILSARGLCRIPDGLTGLVPSRFGPFATTPLVSPIGKLRVAMEYFIPPRRDGADESIESFVVRRLGREMYTQVVEPLLSGISAGDGARLGMESMFPQLWAYEREHGGLIRGMLAAKRRAAAARGSPGRAVAPAMGFLSLPNGLGELVEAVETTVQKRPRAESTVTIQADARVSRIEAAASWSSAAPGISHGFVLTLSDNTRIAADAVVMATPAYVSAALLRSMDGELSRLLEEIEYGSTVTISLAYAQRDVPRPLDATGYIVPRILQRPVLACTWTSAKFQGRAPAGHALFRLFMGGVGRRSYIDLSDAELMQIARQEMRDVMGITAEPGLVRINRFDRAMPQHEVGHLSRVTRIEARARNIPGLALAGAAYRGVGIPDCIRSGERAAEYLLSQLRGVRPSESRNLP